MSLFYLSVLLPQWTFNSVMMSLLYEYLDDNTSVKSFVQNGFIITKSKYNNNFIVTDLETGIARDINTVNNFCGAYKEWYPIRTISIMGNWLLWWQESNPWDLGDEIFAWDGRGRVFLKSFLLKILVLLGLEVCQ